MKEQEFKNKREELYNKRNEAISNLKKEVDDYVRGIQIGDFKAVRVFDNMIEVAMVKDVEQVFGTNFTIYVQDHGWAKVKVTANIGTCGSFELGVGDYQELKYIAFAKFMKYIEKYGLKEKLIRCYNECKGIFKEQCRLGRELEKSKK